MLNRAALCYHLSVMVRSADGVSIVYQVAGSGNPTLVFVHGWCCDKSYWEPQVSHFAQKYRVVTIDLGGHGESALERDKWTMDAFGEDVAAVVDHLALEQVVLMGHSMGGAVVLEAAQRIPKGVLGIVGVDTFVDVNRKADPATVSQLRALRLSSAEAVLVERIVSDMSSVPPSVVIGAAEEFVSYDLGQALERTTVPVRCLSADYHPFNLEAAQQHCPSCEVAFMSGVGHFVMLEDPATFNRLLERIIQELVT